MQRLLTVLSITSTAGHGWVRSPISKNELSSHHFVTGMPDDFRYEPQTSNHGNGIGEKLMTGGAFCGAEEAGYTKGLSVWQRFYDKAGVPVPILRPGQTMGVNMTLTIDHGGQAWMGIACSEVISDAIEWTLLERSPNDRRHHFLPSAPGAFAWAPMEFGTRPFHAEWMVPADFSCATGKVVGRWVWKTSNSCNDYHNVGRPTQKFPHDEYLRVVRQWKPGTSWVNQACGSPPESFISCIDFQLQAAGPTPSPTPGPAPVPPPPPPPPPPAGPCIADWRQCGGDGWTGATCCKSSGSTCQGTVHYKQCKPSRITATQTVDSPMHAPRSRPVTANADPVNSCHEAAKAFCTNGHSFCHACQGWGSWGDMFFTAVCNDEPTTCHSGIVAADGTVCSCQRQGGCSAGGATCPYVPATPPGPSPSLDSPPPSLPPKLPPPPAGPCIADWRQCGGDGWTGATCCESSGSTCQGTVHYKQCKPAEWR